MSQLRVVEVADSEDGQVVHYLEAPPKELKPGDRVHGQIDAQRGVKECLQAAGFDLNDPATTPLARQLFSFLWRIGYVMFRLR